MKLVTSAASLNELDAGSHLCQLVVLNRSSGRVALPMVVQKGENPGHTLCITAGIHPTEYAGMEAALRIGRNLNPSKLHGRLIVLPFVNLLGVTQRTVGICPEDSVDLFKAFTGRKQNEDRRRAVPSDKRTIGYIIASKVFNLVRESSDFLIDLHGGEMNESKSIFLSWYCETGNPKTDASSFDLAACFGSDYLLNASEIYVDKNLWSGPKGTLMYEASKSGIPSLIGEAGGDGKPTEDAVNALYHGIIRACRRIHILDGEFDRKKFVRLHKLTLLTSKYDGLQYSLVEPGQVVRKNQLLCRIVDWSLHVKQQIRAPFEGIVTIKLNSLPIRKGEYVLAMAQQSSSDNE